MKILSLLLAFSFAVTSVYAETEINEKKGESKTLILFYSQTGTTKQIAEELQKRLGADVEEIKATNPYAGTYDETIARCREEMGNNTLPQISPIKANIKDYDTVFLGYPVWFGICARPMLSLINTADFANKRIVPFCTFGSGGIVETTEQLKKALPLAKVENGFGIRQIRIDRMATELDRFLKINGYIEGKVEQLPEYSALKDVTEKDCALFNAACGDYKFPMGTPISVGSRTTASGTDYLFVVNGTNPQGESVKSKVYITVETNQKPVFTLVVR